MKVKQLVPNDTIGIICPAFKGDMTSSRISKLESLLTSLGYRFQYGSTCYASSGYLAGPDDLRVSDIETMFANPDIKAIMCLKGGYGSSRIVDKINYDIIKQNPKLFMGFSDITVLLNSFYQKACLPTIHGQLGIFLGHPNMDEASFCDFTHLMKDKQLYRHITNPNNDAITLVSGMAEGVLVGGNLSLITNLIGTPYDIDFTNRMVFIEEVEEDPYRVDRMFAQLRLSGKLKQAKGFVFGYFTDCISEDKKDCQSVNDLIKEYFGDLHKPIIYNFASGHDFPFMNIPVGLKVKLDANKKELIIMEELYEKN